MVGKIVQIRSERFNPLNRQATKQAMLWVLKKAVQSVENLEDGMVLPRGNIKTEESYGEVQIVLGLNLND